MLDWQTLALPACALGESPRYAHGCWMWVDIGNKLLYRLQQSNIFSVSPSKLHTLQLPDEIGCILPTAKADTLVALGRKGGWLIQDNICTHKLAAPFDSNTHRFNDGRADSAGRIWVSTLVDARTPATAALYCIEQGKSEIKIPNLIVGNGLAFSPKGNCAFLSDTRHKCIWHFDCHASTGALMNQRLIKQYTDGSARPDGACFSDDGSYWVAVLDGYRLDRFSEQGIFIESIEIPLSKPTMPCFGGEDGNVLLVCSAQASEEFPNKSRFENSSLIACKTQFKGHVEAAADPKNLGE